MDKLVKVFLRDGSEKWLLIHIEIHGYRESDFPKRVYHCNYRKKHFLLELYRRGMSREMIVALYEFISVLMALPEAKDEELYDEIKQTSEETQMSLLTIAERRGREEGLEEGLKQTISENKRHCFSHELMRETVALLFVKR
jgi:hypothetical protein